MANGATVLVDFVVVAYHIIRFSIVSSKYTTTSWVGFISKEMNLVKPQLLNKAKAIRLQPQIS